MIWACMLFLVWTSSAYGQVGRQSTLQVQTPLLGETIWYEDFELGWGDDWFADSGVWGIGPTTTVPPSPGSGRNTAGTNLTGNYPRNTDSRLISPIRIPRTGRTDGPLAQSIALD